MNKYSKTSLERLEGCHPDLQDLFHAVLQKQDHTIISGYRGPQEQNDLYHAGKSQLKYPKSKHNAKILDRETDELIPGSRAVDALPYDQVVGRMVNGDHEHDMEKIFSFATLVFETAAELNIKVRWGGNWKSFKDYPHWELMP